MSYAANAKDNYFKYKWGRDNVGSRGIGKQMITGRVVKSFKVLAESLVKHYGSKRKMCEATGLTTGTLWHLQINDTLSKDTGALILAAHREIKRAGQ